ncbi:MAG: transglutaminase domain-containing protein [Candidatus Electrothrix sp. AR4]|nr:transglutaminase domain-containing protein [Candidatus Electrothrix sp. AR4]
MAIRSFWCRLILLSFFLFLTGCVRQPLTNDFSEFQDQPLQPDAIFQLRQGRRSAEPHLAEEVRRAINGRNRRQRLYQVMDYVWKNFTYDAWFNDKMFQRGAGQMSADKILGGCADYALIAAAMLRTAEVPARLVITVHSEWLQAFRSNPLTMFSGHVFLEVYLEDRWYLADPSYRKLYVDYSLTNKYFPRGFIFCLRGVDYQSLGLRSIEQLYDRLPQCITDMVPERYRDPAYTAFDL